MSVQRQVDTVVHIGAGRCGEFEEYKATGARRIVLIEPEPESARYLRQMLTELDNVRIAERAVSSSDGPHELRLFNVRGFSSLREPTGLRELFPGLRKTGELFPDTWSVRRMCEELKVEENEFNRLIVDAPGEEQAILEGLRDEGLLERFEWVSFYAGLSPLYKGNGPAEEIRGMLEEQGYETISRKDEAEPERPRWTLYRDEVKVRNRQLEQKISELNKLLQEHSEEVEKLKSAHDVERQARETAESERDENKKHVEAKSSEVERLKKEVQHSSDEAQKLREQTERLQAELEEHKKDAAQRAEEVEKLKSDRDTERQARETAERERDEQKELAEERQKNSEQKQNEVAELKKRLQMSQEEIFKAEGQLDVMKDMLLGDERI